MFKRYSVFRRLHVQTRRTLNWTPGDVTFELISKRGGVAVSRRPRVRAWILSMATNAHRCRNSTPPVYLCTESLTASHRCKNVGEKKKLKRQKRGKIKKRLKTWPKSSSSVTCQCKTTTFFTLYYSMTMSLCFLCYNFITLRCPSVVNNVEHDAKSLKCYFELHWY